MSADALFSACNIAALTSWMALILLPRNPLLLGTIRWGVISALSLLYAVLIAV